MKRTSNVISKTEALMRLQNLCSRIEKSEFDIRNRLIEWGLEKEAATIISQLKKDDFLNPVRYAQAFTHDKITMNKWGKNKVRYQLRGHQIPEEIIERTLSEYDEGTYRDMIFAELRKKRRSIKDKNHYKIKAKLYAFGNQRGYESSIINEYLAGE